MTLALHFLGVGSAQAVELGSSGAVLERDGAPLLLIDCGPETLTRYLDVYNSTPSSVYLTHTHMDHVAGLERLFYRVYFDAALRGSVKLYTHAALLPYLQALIADYPNVIAEGGANFWDAFHLCPVRAASARRPVVRRFSDAPPRADDLVRLGPERSFAWTGDTRPIPEQLAQHAGSGEVIAHDCALMGNPSHSGVDDLEREYPRSVRERIVAYHYGSVADGDAIAARGVRIARRGDRIALPEPVLHSAAVAAAALVN
jgi:ribonuclease BN (tRNA processing enzyme)